VLRFGNYLTSVGRVYYVYDWIGLTWYGSSRDEIKVTPDYTNVGGVMVTTAITVDFDYTYDVFSNCGKTVLIGHFSYRMPVAWSVRPKPMVQPPLPPTKWYVPPTAKNPQPDSGSGTQDYYSYSTPLDSGSVQKKPVSKTHPNATQPCVKFVGAGWYVYGIRDCASDASDAPSGYAAAQHWTQVTSAGLPNFSYSITGSRTVNNGKLWGCGHDYLSSYTFIFFKFTCVYPTGKYPPAQYNMHPADWYQC
jgi:hypothetical protein